MNNFTVEMMERLSLPADAKELFYRLSEKLSENEEYLEYVKGYEGDSEKTEHILLRLEEMAEPTGESKYSAYFVFFLECLEGLYNKYIARGLPLEVFYDSVEDLKYKFDECLEVEGVYGTFVPTWYPRFYRVDRFKLGRLQYEVKPYPYDRYEKDGIVILKDEPVLNIHIPSCGPLKREERESSYKKAVEFYGKYFNFLPKAFICNSWLLYPDHLDFLNPDSNIIDFMKDFDIISKEDKEFLYAWRIFGKSAKNLPVEEWSEKTSLQKAYKSRVLSGGKTGVGFGVKTVLTNDNLI